MRRWPARAATGPPPLRRRAHGPFPAAARAPVRRSRPKTVSSPGARTGRRISSRLGICGGSNPFQAVSARRRADSSRAFRSIPPGRLMQESITWLATWFTGNDGASCAAALSIASRPDRCSPFAAGFGGRCRSRTTPANDSRRRASKVGAYSRPRKPCRLTPSDRRFEKLHQRQPQRGKIALQ